MRSASFLPVIFADTDEFYAERSALLMQRGLIGLGLAIARRRIRVGGRFGRDIAQRAQAAFADKKLPLQIAVMGCVVNGPGEAREADLGVASGNGKGQIFVKGQVIKTVPEAQIVETLIEEAMRLAEEMEAAGVASGQPSVDVR